MTHRRHWLIAAATFAATVAGTTALPAAAQPGFPTKPLTLVVPFAPGGPTDAMARVIANALKPSLGQPTLVDNKPGAGGNIGAEFVARAEADGHTMLFGTSGPLAINVSLFSKIAYDPSKSFAPVIQVGHLPNVLVVNNAVPAKNAKELIAYAKAHPGQLSFASSGNGASSHLAGVMFNQRAGTDIQHIPYKGTGPALNDLLGGQVTMSFTDVLTALPHIKAGKLRVLGVTSAARSQSLPDVPTLQESGFAGFDIGTWFGVLAPARTPADVVARLNAEMVKVIQSPDFKKRMQDIGAEPIGNTPAQMAEQIAGDTTRFAKLVADHKITTD